MIAVDRLTADDEVMLWPDATWPQVIAALAVLDGRDLLEPDGRLPMAAVRATVADRLHLVPRLRQRLLVPGRGLGRPLWVDAARFDIDEHVHATAVPAPGDDAQLLLVAEELRQRRLDRSRPLWEMWFLTGLPDRRVGLVVKLHHCLADGMAALATIGALLDPAGTTRPGPRRSGDPTTAAGAGVGPGPPQWTPAPEPPPRVLLADNLSWHRRELGHALTTLVHPVTTLRHLRAAWPATRELFAGEAAPRTSLDRLVGPGRTHALVRGRLDTVRNIAHSSGATVNDVLLTLTAGGLRALLSHRGELVDDLRIRVYVPVTLRSRRPGRAPGNLIGQMVVPLPVGSPEPRERLRRIAAETATRKARSRPPLGTLFRGRVAGLMLVKLLGRHPVNVTTANLSGPKRPAALAGARLLEVFPMLPLIANVSLAVGALSYAGQFTIMATADRDAYPDFDVFVAGVHADLTALTPLAQVGRA